MYKPKLSIVVPIYNIQDYLPSCLNSILEQDYQNYELLLINDGSTDNSGKIADDYALKNKRIKVFHQLNAGVSNARNLGLNNALGEWVCFVDGDDEIYPDSLMAILDKANLDNSEMIIARSFKYRKEQLTDENYGFSHTFLGKIFDGYNLITRKSYKRGSVCGCFYKTDFLNYNNINFPIGLKNGEDSIFMSLVYLFAQRISFIDQIFYLVNEREGSASRSWTFERVLKMKDNIAFINTYIENHPELNKEQRHILNYSIYGVISAIFNHLYYCFSISNYLKMLKAVRKELKGKLNTGDISISENKVKLLNLSLTIFSLTVLFNQSFRQLSS